MVPQRICQHTGFPVCQLCPCQSMLQYAAIMKSVFTPLLMLPAWRWYLQVARWPGVGDLRKSSSLDLLMSHMEMLYGFLRVVEWHSNIFIGFSFPLRFNRLNSSTVELLNCCVPTGLDDRWPGWTAGWKHPEPRYDGQWRNGKQHGLVGSGTRRRLEMNLTSADSADYSSDYSRDYSHLFTIWNDLFPVQGCHHYEPSNSQALMAPWTLRRWWKRSGNVMNRWFNWA